MGRKRRKYDVDKRKKQATQSDNLTDAPGPDNFLDLKETAKSDEANPLVLSQETVVPKKKEKQKPPPPKILSKKQRKKLELILKRKEKTVNRSQVLEELAKYTLSEQDLKKLEEQPRIQGRRGKNLKRKNRDQVEEDDQQNEVSPQESSKRIKLPLPSQVEEEEEEEQETDPNIVVYRPNDDTDEESSEEEEEEKEINDNNIPPPKLIEEDTFEKLPEKKDVKPILVQQTKQVQPDNDLNPLVHVRVNRTQEIEDVRSKLPILGEEQYIVETIRYNDVVIICGETGSGKTTQVPQFLYEAGYSSNKEMMCITEPRRVAAISMSTRVAHEMNVSPDVVSYHIRYDKNVTNETKVKFVTDGVLLKEIQSDFYLSNYSVVIIDEAHERSVFSDILIGLLSRIVIQRRKQGHPLKLVIMSATLRVDDFAKNTKLFTIPPPLISVEARQFPVTIHFSKKTPDNFVTGALSKVAKIHRSLPPGGILVFVTGRNDVTVLVKKLRKMFPMRQQHDKESDQEDPVSIIPDKKRSHRQRRPKVVGDLLPKISLDDFNEKFKDPVADGTNDSEEEDIEDDFLSEDDEELSEEVRNMSRQEPLHCLPLYSLLPKEKQDQVFKPAPPGTRLCVVATNVAETSLTIPDIKYVVDTGKVKKKVYDKTTGISTFLVDWCSKASANQRAGRAGRTCPGHCFRLYSSSIFTHDFEDFSQPEIVSKPIDDLVLQMKALDILNVDDFPFPTPPSNESLVSSEKRLLSMGALKQVKTSVSVNGRKATAMTPMGRMMSQFPVSPRYSRMLIYSHRELLPYVIALVSGLTVQEIFLSSLPNIHATTLAEEGDEESKEDKKKRQEVKAMQSKWSSLRRKWSGTGNSLLLGDLMPMLKAIGASEFTGGSFAFSLENGISHKGMSEVHKLRRQLTQEVNRVFSSQEIDMIPQTLTPPDDRDALHLRQIALAGFFDHVARRVDGVVKDAEGNKINSKKRPYQSIQVDDYVFIDAQSSLSHELPEFVVYQEIHETTKMYMRNVVAIEPEWLAIYSISLCTLSSPLEEPAPYFDKEKDAVFCYVEGTFGPHAWKIPVTAVEFPQENTDCYKWFARFLLEGNVIESFSSFSDQLISSPKILLKSWVNLHPKLLAISNTLETNGICSKSSLMKKLSLDQKFLLPQLKEWIPSSAYFSLENYWFKLSNSN